MIHWFQYSTLGTWFYVVGLRAPACSLLLASNYLLSIITGFQLLFLYHNWLSITSFKSQLACVYLLLIMTGLQLANFRWVEPSSTCSFSAHCCFANHFRSLASIFNFDLKSTMSAGLGWAGGVMFSISYEIFLSDEGNFKVVFIFVRLRNLSECHM